MTLALYSWRELRRRPGRTMFTVAGIAIGVASFIGIAVTIQSARTAHADMFTALAGRASLEVVAHGGGGFGPEVADQIARVTGVEAAVPVIEGVVALAGPGGATPLLITGIDPSLSADLRPFEIESGGLDEDIDGLLLEASFAKSQNLKLKSQTRLLSTAGLIPLEITGLLAPGGIAGFSGGAVGVVSLKTAERLFSLPKSVNLIQIILEPGADSSSVEAAIRSILPAGLAVRQPLERSVLTGSALHSTELGLSVISVVSLIAGACVILNAFQMNLGERRRDLAIVRSLGATRRQIARLLAAEALVIGLVGALCGLPLGYGLAFGMMQTLGKILGVALPAPSAAAGPIAFALLLGPGLALLATWMPIRRAAGRAPLADLIDVGASRETHVRQWPAIVGLILLASNILLVTALLQGGLPPRLIEPLLPACMGGFCASVVLTLPLYSRPLNRLAGRILRFVAGPEGRLASMQLTRHAGRTGLTVGVLAISIVLALGFGNSTMNSVDDVRAWGENIGNVDFFVRGSLPDPGTMSLTVVMDDSVADRVSSIPGVKQVGRMSFTPATAQGEPLVVLAGDYSAIDLHRIKLVSGSPDEIQQCLSAGGVVVATTLGMRLNLEIGDTITLDTREGPTPLRVCGTLTEYTAGGMTLYMNWNQAKRLFQLEGPHLLTVHTSGEAIDSVTAALDDLAKTEGLMVQSRAEFRQMIDDYMNGLIGSIFVIMAMVFVVAALGVVNTLTMNVLEQTRDIGVMRAVAMTRRQLRRMIAAQSLGVAIIALFPGLAGGLLMSWLMNRSSYPLTGFLIDFNINIVLLAAILVATLAVSLLGAWPPAARASRLSVIKALHYE